jgi:hypothetical protein
MSRVFLDTAGLIAVVDVDDQWHSLAETVWRELMVSRAPILTTSLVLIEMADGLSRIKHRRAATELRDRLAGSGVEALEPFRVRLDFTNGTAREVDSAVCLRGPVFEPIRDDPAVFRSVRVDPELGTIVWPNGADLDPDALCRGLKPAWMEEEVDDSTLGRVSRTGRNQTAIRRMALGLLLRVLATGGFQAGMELLS